MRAVLAAALAAALAFAGMARAEAVPPPPPPWIPPAPGQPVDSAPPNGKGQAPAFPGQTRAPYAPSHVDYRVVAVAGGLEHPWGLAFLPDGRMLVTEKPGRLRVVAPDGKVSPPVGGLPAVDARQGGGLLDVAVDPEFARNRLVYWCYAEPRGDGAGTTLARAVLTAMPDGGTRLDDVRLIFRMQPTADTWRSFGCRIAFDRAGAVFLTIGDLDFDPFRPLVQRLDTDVGKVVRVNRDGSIPRDNPFVGKPGARPEIWAVGFRNPLGAAIDPASGDLWTVENGPNGGDELNHVLPGRNYGWPVISYGVEYDGKPVGEGLTARAGMEQPAYYWDPVIAPSSLMFYTGGLFPAWKGDAFVGSLKLRRLVRLAMKDGQVVGEEPLLTELNERIRDAVQGPDGALYVLTDADDGKVLKLTP